MIVNDINGIIFKAFMLFMIDNDNDMQIIAVDIKGQNHTIFQTTSRAILYAQFCELKEKFMEENENDI